ncbi:DotA/TraY family protein [Vibrio mediterranei]
MNLLSDTRYFLRCLLCVSVLLLSVVVNDAVADTAPAVSPDNDVPELDLNAKMTDYATKMKEYNVAIASGSELWFPAGFFDGPHKDDLGLNLITQIFGTPVTHIYNAYTGTASTTPVDPTLVTLPTMYARLMNSVGMVIILVFVTGSVIGTAAQRAMDINYLDPKKEEIGTFIMARSVVGAFITFPVPMLGGMSILQGVTLTVIIIGLGFATAIIRLSVPFLLAPSMTLIPNIPTNSFVDHVLSAKTCALTLASLDGASLSESQGMEIRPKVTTTTNTYRQLAETTTEWTANFGATADVKGNECGSISFGTITKPSAGAVFTDTSRVVNYVTAEAGIAEAKAVATYLWTHPTINRLAAELSKSTQPEISTPATVASNSDIDQYIALQGEIQNRMQANIANSVRSALETPLDTESDAESTINAYYRDKIANMGIFGLGSYYTLLSQKQVEANEQLTKILAGMEPAGFIATTVDSNFLVDLWNYVMHGSPDERIQHVIGNIEAFHGTMKKYAPRNNPQELMLDALHEHQNPSSGIAQGLAQMVIQVFRTSESGVYFPNPITEMRTVGNTIINVTTGVIAGGWALQSFSPIGKVSKAMDAVSSGDSMLGKLLTSVLMGLIGIGIFYSYIVPNLPYIMWSVAIFSYLSFATMAVIGAGWWGGALAAGMQRNLHGRFGEGANILLTLAVQPFLMTMAFFLSMVLNVALGYYLHYTLEAATTAAAYGGLNIWQLFGVFLVNGIVMLAGVIKNLGLIWEMTDKFQSMLGFRAADLKQGQSEAMSESRQMSGQFSSNFKQAASSAIVKPGYAR